MKLVLGVTLELFQKVAPALTVYSHRGFVNPLTAPRLALLALGLSDGQGVDSFIANRGGKANGSGIANGVLAPSLALTDWAFTVTAALQMPSGGIYRRAVVVRITTDPQHPFWIQSWRETASE